MAKYVVDMGMVSLDMDYEQNVAWFQPNLLWTHSATMTDDSEPAASYTADSEPTANYTADSEGRQQWHVDAGLTGPR